MYILAVKLCLTKYINDNISWFFYIPGCLFLQLLCPIYKTHNLWIYHGQQFLL